MQSVAAMILFLIDLKKKCNNCFHIHQAESSREQKKPNTVSTSEEGEDCTPIIFYRNETKQTMYYINQEMFALFYIDLF